MDLTLVAITGIILLLLLMAVRVPISYGMILLGFLGVVYIRNWDAAVQLLASDMWAEFSSYTLTAIPAFIFMGNLAFKSGLSDRLYKTANAWIGHWPGGLASTTILASAGFGAICGSGVAATATMTTVSMPEMKKYDYDMGFSGGMLAVAGTLGIILPPSLIMIIVATTVGESVTKLFIAGIIPGLFLTGCMLALTFWMCWRNPELGPPAQRSTWAVRFKSLSSVGETLLIFALVMGGIYLGWFTATEAGAIGAFGMFVSAMARRQLTWESFRDTVTDTARLSTMVVLLIAAGMVFGKFITFTRLPFTLVEWVEAMNMSTFWVLMAMIIIYVIGGMFIDSVAFLVLSLPIFFPLATSLGYDPIWFLLMTTVVTALGSVTPPVGVHVFVVASIHQDVPLSKIFRGSNIFLITYVVLIAVMIAFPDLFTGIVKIVR
ncbi:MAG: TRAP transporter large permease [Pseudaminobacter sp.]